MKEVRKVKYFCNLANGLDVLDRVKFDGFVRIQSTLCEAKAWDRIIYDLDYNFLLTLAQGDIVYVWDMGKRGVPRALYQGIVWIRYVLNRRWFDKKERVFVNGCNVVKYFSEQYEKLSTITKKKLDYMKKFLNTNEIDLRGYSLVTKRDGDYIYYRQMLRKNWNGYLGHS